MPRRPSDNQVGKDGKMETRSNIPKKSERTHEENQERAYIAASRRSDRSIEARIQSARQASQIHKKRTGKALRITEEIVRNEEMYEEEEDEFPRSYRVLAPHMVTENAEFNNKVENYLRNKIDMSNLVMASGQSWQRETDINRQFAEIFPNATAHAQRLSQQFSPGLPGPPTHNASHQNQNGQFAQRTPQQSPISPAYSSTFQNVNYQQSPAPQHQRLPSFSSVPPTDSRRASHVSTPVMTPGSTPQSQAEPFFPNAAPAPQAPSQGPSASPFTHELPAEARMMLPMNWNFDSQFNGQMWPDQTYEFAKSDVGQGSQGGYYGNNTDPLKWEAIPQASNPGEEPAWDTFLNDAAFTHSDGTFNVDGTFNNSQNQR